MMAEGYRKMSYGIKDEAELKKFRDFFRSMDTNEDGILNWSEFQRMTDNFGINLNFDEMRKAYQRVDQNHDGGISFKEFLDRYVNEPIRTKKISTHSNEYQVCKGVRYSPLDGTYSLGTGGESTHGTNAIGRKLSTEEFNQGSQYFWKSDKDGDGKLSVTEFAHMLSTLGLKPTNRDVNKAFKMADEDSDGFVSFEEFVKTYLMKIKTRSTTDNRVTTVYNENDVGKKGFLTKQECCKAMRTLGNSINEKTLDKLMKIVNKGYDGKISFEDFNLCLGTHDSSM